MKKIIELFEEKSVFETAKNTQELQTLSKDELVNIIAELGYLLEEQNENNKLTKSQIEHLKNEFLEI